MREADLPKGWCWTDASSLIEGISSGKSFRCEERPPQVDEVGVLKVSAVTWGVYNEEESKTCTNDSLVNPQLFVRPGDFLFSRANTIELVGACVIAGAVQRRVMLSDKILRFDVLTGWHKWLMWVLRSAHGRSEIERLATGNQESMRNIGQERIQAIRIPLACSGEQSRIVEQIESYFSRLDAAVATLERVERNLKRYRASVLKAAVEGRLVPTEAELARQEGRTYEPASVLLERILIERRRRWSESGKKGKYQEPTPPDTSDLPPLPEGWCWATVDQLLTRIEAGKSFRCEERPPLLHEVGVVKVSSVSWGRFREDESKTCMNAEFIDDRLMIKSGDLLISRANTVELVGACVIVGEVHRRLMLSDKILRMRLIGDLNLWILWVLRSALGRDQIERLASGNQQSMRNIGQSDIASICVPLPPVHECIRVISRIEAEMLVVEKSDQVTQRSLLRSHRIRQSILKWAFEGKLADQDPSDEPASVLLARIQAKHSASQASARTASRKRPGPAAAAAPGAARKASGAKAKPPRPTSTGRRSSNRGDRR